MRLAHVRLAASIKIGTEYLTELFPTHHGELRADFARRVIVVGKLLIPFDTVLQMTESDTSIQCPDCGQTYHHKRSLQRHRDKAHSK